MLRDISARAVDEKCVDSCAEGDFLQMMTAMKAVTNGQCELIFDIAINLGGRNRKFLLKRVVSCPLTPEKIVSTFQYYGA